jgi:hypothetical protein
MRLKRRCTSPAKDRSDEAAIDELAQLIRRYGARLTEVVDWVDDPNQEPVLAARARLRVEHAATRQAYGRLVAPAFTTDARPLASRSLVTCWYTQLPPERGDLIAKLRVL